MDAYVLRFLLLELLALLLGMFLALSLTHLDPQVTDATLSFSSWDQEVASWERVVDRSIVARESEYST